MLKKWVLSSAALALITLTTVPAMAHPTRLVDNQWTRPCFQGVCSYDITQTDSSLGGTVLIFGSPYAISDITPAAGWEIIECAVATDEPASGSGSHQIDVRLVCSGDPTGCAHLYEHGAESTLVRLPENCGNGPFAVVLSASISNNQSLPSHLRSNLVMGDGSESLPEVKSLTLDTRFSRSSPSRHGPVSFTIVGSSIPGFYSSESRVPAPAGGKPIRRSPNDRVQSALKEMSRITKNISTSLPPLSVDKTLPLFQQSIACLDGDTQDIANVSIDIGVNARVDANFSLGFVAAGTFFPPKVTEFGVYTAMTADLNATFTISTNASGIIDMIPLTIFSSKFPGLHVPGLLSIEPTFDIRAQTKIDIDIDVELAVDLAYRANGLQLFFPPEHGASSADMSPADSHLKVSASPGASSNGSIEARLLPTLNISITAFDEISASVSLDVVALTRLNLDLNLEYAGDSDLKPALENVSGCIGLAGDVSARAAAHGAFFDIWGGGASVAISEEGFALFQICFHDGSPVPSAPGPTRVSGLAVPAALDYPGQARPADVGSASANEQICPALSSGPLEAFVDEVIRSSSL
ncbi:hypothetical protein DFH11DRAFT_1604755 [Phellopilus nigrolimitatus]|nr:hypothetical protein DFH11DRAFT_1604755 [Phellopilus nigrolimitatus]